MGRVRHWCAASVVLLAASMVALGQSADEAVQGAMRKIGAGDVGVLWDALPASYQQDVSRLVHTAAAKMDPVVWDRTFLLAGKLADVMKAKKDLMFAAVDAGTSPEEEADYKAAIEAGTDILSLLANSEISRLENVRKLDMAKFAAGTGSRLGRRIIAFQKAVDIGVMGVAELAAMKDAKVSLVGSENGVAMLSIEAPDPEEPDEMVGGALPFVQVDGKWVPQAMAARWPEWVSKVEARVRAMEPTLDEATLRQFVAVADAIDQQLDTLAETEDQQRFNGRMQTVLVSLTHLRAPLQQMYMRNTQTANRETPEESD